MKVGVVVFERSGQKKKKLKSDIGKKDKKGLIKGKVIAILKKYSRRNRSLDL